jgi:hypothetical protein
VVVALNHCIDLLKNKQTDTNVPNEAVALALVEHFVGDIHQPLHCTARYEPGNPHKTDLGGNTVTVTNLVQTPWPNLHTFWDESYRRHYRAGKVEAFPEAKHTDGPGSPELKKWLRRVRANEPTKPDLHVDIAKWAGETHTLGCQQVYGTLGEPYGSTNITLRSAYVVAATRTARRQLCLAGYRLGNLLNEIYGQ